MTIAIQPAASDLLFHILVTDKITRADYEHWVPALDARIAKHGGVSILFEMRGFHGWTAGALWADLKFGVQHFTKIDRIAIVGEQPWQKGMAMFCKPFTMARIRYFPVEDIAAAKEWLQGEYDKADSTTSYDVRTASAPVVELLRILDGQDGIAREQARAKLVEMGPLAISDLVRAAQGGSRQLRLETTKALATIADPKTATALAAQFDDTLEIAWAAAEGVKRLGRDGAVAALRELVKHPNSHVVRVSAHHALRHMEASDIRETVAPVAASLLDEEPITAVLVAADAALVTLAP